MKAHFLYMNRNSYAAGKGADVPSAKSEDAEAVFFQGSCSYFHLYMSNTIFFQYSQVNIR